MGYHIEITARARKDIECLDVVLRKRLRKRLDLLAGCSNIYVYAKKLEGSQVGEYRIRVGDYRILCDIEAKTIFMIRFRHRREVYLDR